MGEKYVALSDVVAFIRERPDMTGDEKIRMCQNMSSIPVAHVRQIVYGRAVKVFNDPWSGRMFTTCSVCCGKISPKDDFCKHCGVVLKKDGEISPDKEE